MSPPSPDWTAGAAPGAGARDGFFYSRQLGYDVALGALIVGAGLDYAVGERVFLRTEYRYSDYGDRLRGQQFLAGVGLRF